MAWVFDSAARSRVYGFQNSYRVGPAKQRRVLLTTTCLQGRTIQLPLHGQSQNCFLMAVDSRRQLIKDTCQRMMQVL